MSQEVIFRSDGNSEIGLGHVVRCIALADYLTSEFNCSFAVNQSDSTAKESISARYSFVELGAESSLADVEKLIELAVSKSAIVVLDGYHFDQAYLDKLNNHVPVVFIDDKNLLNYNCPLVVNQAMDVDQTNYKLGLNSKIITGEDYALLRHPFGQNDQRKSSERNLFICFGASDPGNYTAMAIDAALNSKADQIHVVIGGSNPRFEELTSAYHNKQLHFHHNLKANDMFRVMNKCSMAIAPASGISYEIMSVGMGFVCGTVVDNQQQIHQGLLSRNCIKDIGEFGDLSSSELTHILDEYISGNEMLTHIYNQKRIIDGNASKRYIEEFQKLKLKK